MINGKRVNYVIATWAGDRVNRTDGISIRKDQYLSLHLKSIKKYQTCLDQITIFKPKCENEGSYYDILKDIDDNVVIIDGKNEGQSYGQYLKVVDHYKDKFDYYIFCEDDYLPYGLGFDEKLVHMYEELRRDIRNAEKSIYLCGLLDERGGRALASISNGIVDYPSLEKIFDGESIESVLKRVFKYKGKACQVRFSEMFQVIEDYRCNYSSYFHKKNMVLNYSRISDNHIFVPYEFSVGGYPIIEGQRGSLDREMERDER